MRQIFRRLLRLSHRPNQCERDDEGGKPIPF